MVKRMLWKDIRQTLSKSKGRVVSIVCLMALGSFALVGLKVTGPDMQATAADFYGRNNLADITGVSNYGISKDDERIIGKADGIKEVEYGYFKDVVISGTDRSMRIYSKPDAVSTYDVTEGRLPKRTGEIALDMKERDRFAVGSTLNVTESQAAPCYATTNSPYTDSPHPPWAHASACSPATRCCRLSSPTHTARDSPCRTSCSNSTPGSPWPHSHLHG